MSDKSAIEWTDATWNPVTGCTKISPGCAHCYAEALTLRFKRGGPFLPGTATIKLHYERLDTPNTWKSPRRIFVNSMSDLFHEEVPFEFVNEVFDRMVKYRQHTYQVLTKRPDRLLEYLRWTGRKDWPSHVWAGVSVENQYWADQRIPRLLEVPAQVKFLSVEPLLKSVDLRTYLPDLQWVIVGGESGHKARPMDPEWVRRIRDDCLRAGVPFFFKQWGGRHSKAGGRELDRETWSEMPVSPVGTAETKDRKLNNASLPKGNQSMTTLPPIQPHTQAKHHILEYHLKEWFPILGRSSRFLQVIDGFAGPGRYEGGEDGSPIIALRAVKQHNLFETFDRDGKLVEFLFVEKDREYYQHLQKRLLDESWRNAFTINVQLGEFEQVLTGLLDDVDAGLQTMPPTLLFVDPFGPAGFPLSLFKRLASFSRIDILINLNLLQLVQWILPDPTKHVTANRLYGGDRWKPALNMHGAAKSRFLAEEYQLALSEIGWKTTSFEMVNAQNQVVYHLVFATQSPKGLEAMKRAMRSASQTGTFRFSDGISVDQPVFMGLDAETEYARNIAEHLAAKYDGEPVAYEDLVVEEIDWHKYWLEKDLHDGLKQLESADPARISEVRKTDGSTRRKWSYPSGCLITFQKPPQTRLL